MNIIQLKISYLSWPITEVIVSKISSYILQNQWYEEWCPSSIHCKGKLIYTIIKLYSLNKYYKKKNNMWPLPLVISKTVTGKWIRYSSCRIYIKDNTTYKGSSINPLFREQKSRLILVFTLPIQNGIKMDHGSLNCIKILQYFRYFIFPCNKPMKWLANATLIHIPKWMWIKKTVILITDE